MAQPLLATKLYLPILRPDAIARPHLLTLLDRARNRKLTLVSAPPGFGKTTLLTEWQAHTRFPLSWFSLDDTDNDSLRFWTYFVAALQRVQPELGQAAMATLQSPATTAPVIESVLTELLNQLASLPLESTFGIVLDDYHVITSPAIHQQLAFLLDHLPPQLRLFITSRADPLALPLSRLRVRGELLEIRAAQLRFTLEEALTFFKTRGNLTLSKEDVERLAARTEGWAAGLQLAALSLQDYDPQQVHTFIESFTGTDRFVVDYLLEEVLNRQPEDIQHFLLETSLLERLSGPLCQAVTGREDAAQTLIRLEQVNLFVILLDNRREWFRYHHLFAELLRHRLSRVYQVEQIKELNRRASHWFESKDQPSEAIHYSLAGQDYERAAALLEQVTDPLFQQSAFARLRGWLERLPGEVLLRRPRLYLYYAMALYVSGEVVAALEQLEQAMTILGPDAAAATREQLEGPRLAILSSLVRLQGDFETALHLAKQALELLPAESAPQWRGVALINLGSVYRSCSELDMALETYLEGVALSKVTGRDEYVTLMALAWAAEIEFQQGHLSRARHRYADAEVRLQRAGLQSVAVTGYVEAGLARIALEQNRLEEAEQYITRLVEMSRAGDLVDITLNAQLLLSRLRYYQGDLVGALAAARATQEAWRPSGIEWLMATCETLMMRPYLTEGKLTSAENSLARLLVASPQGDIETGLRFLLGWSSWDDVTAPLRVWLRADPAGEGEKRLAQLMELSETSGNQSTLIELLLLQTLSYQNKNPSFARQSLLRALELAEPEDFIRYFLNEGEALLPLLEAVKPFTFNTPKIKAFVERILSGMPASEKLQTREPFSASSAAPEIVPAKTSSPQPAPAVTGYNQFLEKPSERELEVLRLIAAGLSNQEIAERLVISPNTIKAHINKIYGKLDVSSRTQAILRARELNLL
ncbi:MAG TPA: LuxR C-terminal-related transcriptional regulator [Chloroflexia bacterium]|nr:LuxR C-terminal-related transcriptional regulator [Chloroflexia bacterium]